MEVDSTFKIPKGKRGLIYDDTLIIADVHLGYESEAEDEGVYLPRVQLKQALRDLYEIVSQHSVNKIVIAGDIKHKFEALTWQERVEIEEFVSTLRGYGIRDIALVRGNHDTFIKKLLSNLNVALIDGLYEVDSSIAVIHGHILPNEDDICKYKYLIMGHEHPVVVIRLGGMSTARFPAFLSIPLDCCETKAIVLPAFGVYQSGNPVSMDRNAYLSPLIKRYGILERARLFISDADITLELPEMRYIKEYITA
ncbi:MAG: metallophosphoesterase [Desulfurococcales archaeon]|nr:metallophosphoesterase [Desulfurococcales archaeon]